MAALAAGLAAGASPLEAGALANLAAAVTVEKLNQTGTANPDEIRARYETGSRAYERKNFMPVEQPWLEIIHRGCAVRARAVRAI